MDNKKESINSIVAGVLTDAGLGSLFSKDQEEGVFFGALIGTAIGATAEANRRAKKSGLVLYEVQDGYLCKIYPDGTKEPIRKIQHNNIQRESHFKLK